MKLDCEDYEQLSVMTVKGSLVGDDADSFRGLAKRRIEAKTRDFVLDLSHVEFIDSKGLEAMLWLQDSCAEQLGQVRLAGCQEQVGKILQITRLAARFDCHADVDAAIKSLR